MDNQTPDNESELNIVYYSDKTFIVFGEATKIYKEEMKDFGGKFNSRLKERPGFSGGPGWIFMNKYRDVVDEFVNNINLKMNMQHKGGSKQNIPTVIAPIKVPTYQYVKWKIFKPIDGMSVTIKTGNSSSVGTVIQTKSHKNIVDTVYIDLDGNTSKLVICNGKWQVFGYMIEHTVYFNNDKV